MTGPAGPVDGEAGAITGRPRRVSDDDIFTALTEPLGETGPDGITLARVAARVGLTGPGLGHRFGCKRGMLLAFAERQVGAMEEHFDAVDAANPSPVEALVAALTAVGGRMRTRAEVANNLAMLTSISPTMSSVGSLPSSHGCFADGSSACSRRRTSVRSASERGGLTISMSSGAGPC